MPHALHVGVELLQYPPHVRLASLRRALLLQRLLQVHQPLLRLHQVRALLLEAVLQLELLVLLGAQLGARGLHLVELLRALRRARDRAT